MNDEDNIIFIERTQVKEGVVCDVYKYKDDESKDLGVATVQKGFHTPKQRILKGEKTLEIFKSGKGILHVTRKEGLQETYKFPSDIPTVELYVGDIMQWSAEEDLVFHEICYPPYEEGRFMNL